MKKAVLYRFSYSPGYSDMRGARYDEVLEKRDAGWLTVTSARDHFAAPTVVTTYAVPDDAAEDFIGFLTENEVWKLSNRRKSNLFICDYSPWEFSIVLTDGCSGEGKREYYRIDELQEFSRDDRALIDEMRERFRSLRGEVIATETKEEE